MKIAWFTPFTKTSAIGKVGAQVCEALSRSHQVEIWTHHTEDLIATNVPVVHFDADFSPDALKGYDCIIYNLGNFAGFHREIMDVAQWIPGIVLLHDRTMNSFWGQYTCIPEFGGRANGFVDYQELLGQFAGEAAKNAAQDALDLGIYPFYEQKPLSGYSLLEPCLAGAKGVFTHSAQFAEELRNITNLPVDYAYLPCPLPDMVAEEFPVLSPILQKARAEGRKVLVSTGIVHPIKRIDKVTQVLEQHSELAKKICYLVIGSCGGDYGEQLQAQAAGELNGCLHLLGYQPDAVMNAALTAADMTVNLRYPNSEVCSLSLWEQMACGKPVLTLDRGIYGEVPEDAMVRIRLETEEAGITQALEALVADRLDLSIGTRARSFIETQCSLSRYCEKLESLAGSAAHQANVATLQNAELERVGQQMEALGITEDAVPASFAAITDQLAKVLGGRERPAVRNHVLGIWLGFPYHVPGLNREGISRLMSYLVGSMLRYHPDVEIEAWCYSFNEQEAEIIFSTVRPEDRGRLKLITEQNWAEQLDATSAQRAQVGQINERNDNLVDAVRTASRASVFVPLILYLDRITESGKRLYVPGYDMAVAGHYSSFLDKDPLYAARNSDYIWRVENLVARGGKLFCNSDVVRQGEILKYIRNLKESDTRVVYLPANLSSDIESRLLTEKALREKFSLSNPYLFYPTQIRPYKNVAALIRAFHLLAEHDPSLQLVLTGEPSDVPEVAQMLEEYHLGSRTVLAKNVPESELFSLYRYAAAAPVPSMFEGGFQYQAMEALAMKTPVVLSDIPIVNERIRSLGFTKENCGLALFDPLDAQALADRLEEALQDRSGAVARQQAFADKLLAYTWEEACDQYYDLFFSKSPGTKSF